MKEQIEGAIVDFAKTLSYEGAEIVQSFVRGHGDRPDGLSTLIVDMNHNVDSTKVRNMGKSITVKASGEMYFIFKLEDNGVTQEDADIRNDKIPEILFDAMINNPTLGGTIVGNVTPDTLKGGLYELKNTEGLFFYMSHLTFKYEGPWIPPETS